MIRKFFIDEYEVFRISKTRQVTAFSDLIIVSISLEDIDYMDTEIYEVYYLLLNSIIRGFLLRGSIVYGKLIHTKDVIFGPGLIDAYNREKAIAKYPRIIIDDVIVTDLADLSKKNKTSLNCSRIISRDKDGLYFIDFTKSPIDEVDDFSEYIKLLSSLCDILFKMADNSLLTEKYMWLEEKLMTHVNKHSKILKFSFDVDDIKKDDLSAFKMRLYEPSLTGH